MPTELEEIRKSYDRQRTVLQAQLDQGAKYSDCQMLLRSLWDTERRAMRTAGVHALCGLGEASDGR